MAKIIAGIGLGLSILAAEFLVASITYYAMMPQS